MLRKWLPLAALALASCAARRPGDEDRFRFDAEALPEPERSRVRGLLADPISVAPLAETRVRSPRAVYQFLFENLDFAAACARAVGSGTYRAAPVDGGGFRMDDGRGMTVELRRGFQDEERWAFLCVGTYDTGLFGTFRGDLLVVVRAVSEGEVLVTRGVVYLRLAGGDRLAAALMPRAVRTMMQREGAVFIRASTTVVEACAADAAGFYEKMRSVPEVDSATLEKFRASFIR